VIAEKLHPLIMLQVDAENHRKRSIVSFSPGRLWDLYEPIVVKIIAGEDILGLVGHCLRRTINVQNCVKRERITARFGHESGGAMGLLEQASENRKVSRIIIHCAEALRINGRDIWVSNALPSVAT
jgi:hypothetical protein